VFAYISSLCSQATVFEVFEASIALLGIYSHDFGVQGSSGQRKVVWRKVSMPALSMFFGSNVKNDEPGFLTSYPSSSGILGRERYLNTTRSVSSSFPIIHSISATH
jgi:hypothetical protein